jgi:potassium channel subfamily K
MNDPGLDEPISKDAQDLENQKKDEDDEKKEDELAFLAPR